MCKKLIYLISFILVLSLVLSSIAGASDPDLVAWWKLDETSGTIASDSSGNGNNGTFHGDPQWVTGHLGGALEFDGSGDWLDCGSDQSLRLSGAVSITAWIKVGAQGRDHKIGGNQDGTNGGYKMTVYSNNKVEFEIRTATNSSVLNRNVTGGTVLNVGVWYHVTGVYSQADGYIRTYVNGVLDRELLTTSVLGVSPGAFRIGCEPFNTSSYNFNGVMDDLRIYGRALTEEEIKQVMKGIPPGVASDPSPANEATDVPRDVTLSWTPGEFAPPVSGHKVYLSENFTDVNSGVGGVTQDANSYAPPQRLNLGTTYYWRVDEVNGPPDYTVYKGEVWSFTTEPVGYPIKNVTATASSSHNAEMGPEKTVNGSGLNAEDLHSKEPADMWLSSAEPLGAWIKFEFDKVYKLHQMWVWNSNQMIESLVGFGFKEVTIEYSTNGVDYTTLGTTVEFARAPGTDGYAHNTTVDLAGVAAKYVRLTAKSAWGSIMPQFGLSEVRFFYIPIRAREPSPESGATDVDVDVTLGFRAGREAAQHDVYLSTDEQAVVGGTAPVTTVTKASYGPLSLDLDKTYYWKINEVNMAETPTTLEGDVWSFKTRQFLIVDDFESYNDLDTTDPASNRIFNTWIDGYGTTTNGSIVGYENPPFCEKTIVHGDKQSMPLAYSNIAGKTYSEAERTFAVGQNWTKAGITTLVLYFHGASGNTGQLYVKINGTKVTYDGDALDITRPRWKQWNINLASPAFAGLQNVTKLAIGIDGNGASGKLYFDDIRLYQLAPEIVVSSEEIWIEAEAAATITAPMQIYDDPTASAGKYISTDESVGDSSSNPPANGLATYTFTVAGGTYKVSGRLRIPGGSNSFWVRIQGATIPAETELHSSGWVRWNDMPDTGGWLWSDVFSDDDDQNATVLFTMGPGTYTLEIARREDGAQIDVIVISKVG